MRKLSELGVRVFRMDLTDEASVSDGVEKIITTTGRIDVLVNNAGYGSYGAVEDVPLDEARRQFEVNVFGLAGLIQLIVPHMRAQGSGRIINISSIGGKIYEPLGGWYHATKFAVEGLSDSLRIELRPFGIDVVLIEPGPILSEWNAIARENMAKTSARRRIRRPGGVDDAGPRGRGRIGPVFRTGRGRPENREGRDRFSSARPLSRRARRRDHPAGRRLLPDRAFDAIITRTFR